MKLTKHFTAFFESEKSGGLLLIICTAASLCLANSFCGQAYSSAWHTDIFFKPAEFWINDVLMTVFFLLVGLEIEREMYIGELASIKKALLPACAALGGMIVPAGVHYVFNRGTLFQQGFGIPMATDIAFSLGILSLLGKRVPASLKIFLTALAIIDDLGAIIIIALFYSKDFSVSFFGLALLLFLFMVFLNRLKFNSIPVYLLLGFIMWFFVYRSGIHPTISGVLLAFAVPFGDGGENSPSHRLQLYLHKPVAFLILPLFALANTCILIPSVSVVGASLMATSNSLGIMFGLLIGKPAGIFLFALLGVAFGVCSIPADMGKRDLFGVGLLAGMGFTMSIFITLLAFTDQNVIVTAKIAVIIASLAAGIAGFLCLRFTLPSNQKTVNGYE